MIILGNKYQITDNERHILLQKVNHIKWIDILNHLDNEIINEIKVYLDLNRIEFLILNLDIELSLHIKGYLEELNYLGIKIILFSEFTSKFLDREFVEFNEKNLHTYNTINHNEFQRIIKRIFDFFFSIVSLIFALPIMLIISLLIKIKSPKGSVFFTQQRLGLNGNFFRVYKFRTMIPKAQEKLEEILSKDDESREEYLKYRKLKNDPRIISIVGNFLRKSSLDELPQFFNVLKGDMSVVGPRPYIQDEFYNHEDKFLGILLSVKPGITGFWQVGDRSNTTFNDRVNDDLKYIQSQSFLGDIKIIFQTIMVMISRKGAY